MPVIGRGQAKSETAPPAQLSPNGPPNGFLSLLSIQSIPACLAAPATAAATLPHLALVHAITS